MPKQAEPVALILAKGKKHMGKREIEERQAQELDVPFLDVKPPEYLSKKQAEKFTDIAEKLLAIGIMTELDEDCLARYVLAHDLYLSYTAQLSKMIKACDIEGIKDMQNLQDKVFKQAHTAARALGLTITERCRIVVPKSPEDDDEL